MLVKKRSICLQETYSHASQQNNANNVLIYGVNPSISAVLDIFPAYKEIRGKKHMKM
jgi:hypothetical protein